VIFAPVIYLVFLLIKILRYLPNLEELSFLIVLAFPNASRIGLHLIIIYSTLTFSPELDEETEISFLFILEIAVKNFKAYLAFSVFPAPLSPEITIA
jgi:hypothetical protein